MRFNQACTIQTIFIYNMYFFKLPIALKWFAIVQLRKACFCLTTAKHWYSRF